jgi:hypothetical protein
MKKLIILAFSAVLILGFGSAYGQMKPQTPTQVKPSVLGKTYWCAEVQDVLFSNEPQQGQKLNVGVRVKFTKKTVIPGTPGQKLCDCAFEGPPDAPVKFWSKTMSLRLIGIKYSETETNLLEYYGPTPAFPPYDYSGFQVIGFTITENDLKKGYIDVWGWASKEPLPCREASIYASLAVYNQSPYTKQNECHPHPDFKKSFKPKCEMPEGLKPGKSDLPDLIVKGEADSLQLNELLITVINNGKKDVNKSFSILIEAQQCGRSEYQTITELPWSGAKVGQPEGRIIQLPSCPTQREVRITVDSKNEIEESDETNNTFSLTYPSTPYPDLIVEKAEMIYKDDKGHRADLVFQIKNAGSRASSPSRYLIEIKNKDHDWEKIIRDGFIKYLEPGEKEEVKTGLFYIIDYIGKTFSFGENLIRITLDYQNEVEELNEENNIFVLSFIPRAPDLKITSVNLETKDLGDGTSDAILHFTVKNEGDAYAWAGYIADFYDRQERVRNFLNLTITKNYGGQHKIRFVNDAFNLEDFKNNLLALAPGQSKDFHLPMPFVVVDSKHGIEGHARLSNNCLYGEINIKLTLDEKQLLYDANYENNSYAYSVVNNHPIFKIHPYSPTAYLNLEKEMNFYIISNLDFNEHHLMVIKDTWLMPELKFYWGDYQLKINSTRRVYDYQLKEELGNKYKVPEVPVWEIRAEIPKKEGEAELRAEIGGDNFPLGKIKLYGFPEITKSPDELMEKGKRYSFKGKNFIDPIHFGKMFQNYYVIIQMHSPSPNPWPYYFVSENEFQTEPSGFSCSGEGNLIVGKIKKGYNDVISRSPLGAGVKPIIEFSPTSARIGDSIDITISNYCERITEIKLNEIALEIILYRPDSAMGLHRVKVRIPENATSGKINFNYHGNIIESEKILEILK